MGPTRIMESNSWPCRHPKIPPCALEQCSNPPGALADLGLCPFPRLCPFPGQCLGKGDSNKTPSFIATSPQFARKNAWSHKERAGIWGGGMALDVSITFGSRSQHGGLCLAKVAADQVTQILFHTTGNAAWTISTCHFGKK